MKAVIGKMNSDRASVRIPSSKSLAHRALIAAALAEGTSVLHGIDMNEDIQATIGCLKLFGAEIKLVNDKAVIIGTGGISHYDGLMIDCNESGSTLRFMIPLFANSGKTCMFTGKGRLLQRPQTVYEELFETFDHCDHALVVKGKLKGGNYQIRGDISSQFISGLLFLLPMLEEDSVITVLEPFESESYVDMTIDVLHKAGIRADKQNNVINVPGRQRYQRLNMTIDGDDSQAAFFAVLAQITGREIEVQGMNHDSIQGDHAIVRLLAESGCQVIKTEESYCFKGGISKAIAADLGNCPDLGPALFALASQLKGESHFSNVSRLRIKESDRIEAMEQELRKLGCDIRSTENDVYIRGCNDLEGGVTVNGHGDHRIVMALSVLAASCRKPVTIEGAEAVRKSYPGFFEDLKNMNVEVDVYD